MGQYFMWLNPVKGEYIQPVDFDHGSKRRESSWVGCELLDALFTLMASDWKEDPIVWIGDDYTELHNESNPTLQITEKICGSEPFDYAISVFKNVSCQFSSCDKRDVVTNAFHIEILKKYGLDEDDISQYFDSCCEKYGPFSYGNSFYEIKYKDNFEEFAQFMAGYLEDKGMFARKANSYHLIINCTKKEFINTENIIPDNGYRYNPFPALMIKEDGRYRLREHSENDCCGKWLGDEIHISNDISDVPDDFIEVSNKYTWENGY